MQVDIKELLAIIGEYEVKSRAMQAHINKLEQEKAEAENLKEKRNE